MSEAERYTQIIGGRPLSDDEKARINCIKLLGNELIYKLKQERRLIASQVGSAERDAFITPSGEVKLSSEAGVAEIAESARLANARPLYWIDRAIDEVEVAVMFAVRSIAQPEF